MTCPRCGHPEYSEETGCPACSQQTPAPATGSTAVITSATWEDALTRLEPLPEGAETLPPIAPSMTGLLQAGQQFGGRYQILKVLGKGGMGVVYRAWDEELGVAVALKVIRPEMVSDPKTGAEIERRFKRELVLARQVTHKNVVRIHDLGEMGGIKYLTMPFIQGQDLAGVITSAGKLPVERALLIGRQIAAGLAAAHEVGVIHRDLKPANIMLDNEDHATILDFGIARSASGPTMASAAMVGTLHYMAPEQADGRAVDQRADIYAFGLVLYDMLVGKRRTAATESGIADLMSRIKGPPRSVRELEPGVPEAMAEVIARCLAPDPAHRYQTTGDLVAALDGLDSAGNLKPAPVAVVTRRGRMAPLIAAAALLLSAVAIWIALRPSAPVAVQRDPVSVIIADFDNQTGDEVFDGSLEQALGLGVEGSSFVTAFSRRDARRVAESIQPGARLSEELATLVARREGIKVVLAGRITADGDRYEVSVRAIEAVEPGRLVAELNESARGKPAVLDAVGAVAGSIREALGDTNLDAAPRETFTTASLEAAREYAVAQELANQDRDEEAVARYRRAIELDSTFGRAYSGWAASARKLGRRDEAEKLYQEAFKFLDRMTEREKYRTLGAYYMQIARDYDQAIDNYQALVERYPADSAGHNNLAVAYFSVLDFTRAREEGGKLVAIYPNSVLYRYNSALYAMYASDFASAMTEANEAVKLNAATHRPYVALALSEVARDGGKLAEARSIYQKAAAAAGRQGVSLSHIGLADLAMFEGQFRDAIPLLIEGRRSRRCGQEPGRCRAQAGGSRRSASGTRRRCGRDPDTGARAGTGHATRSAGTRRVVTGLARTCSRSRGNWQDARLAVTAAAARLRPVDSRPPGAGS